MKILITGAGGYIGSVTSYLFLQKGFEVVALDNFSHGFRKPLEVLQKKFGKTKFRFYEMDTKGDLSSLFKKEKGIEAVVHFAGFIVVGESMENPQKYFINNVCGSVDLISCLIEQNINKFVFSSTAAVYSKAEYLPLDEKHPTGPVNPYGESKLMVEKILEWYGQLLNFNYIIFRYFNVCGASDDGLLGYSNKPSTHLIPNAVKGALGIEPFSLTCPVVATKDKTPIRDYVNVVDLAEAHLRAVEYLLHNGKNNIINLGTGAGNSVLEIINKVQEITGVEFDLQKTTPRKGEAAKLVTSIEKAQKILGWRPKRTLEDSIISSVKWFRKHPQGWED